MTTNWMRDDRIGRRRPFDPRRSVAQLPALVAELDPDSSVVVLDDLPWLRFDARAVDQVLRPAIGALVDRVVRDLEHASTVAIRGGELEDNVRQVTEHALRQFAQAVESGHRELETRVYRELGRRHARAGWSLRELTTLIGRGGQACLRGLGDLARDGDLDPQVLAPAGEAVLAFTNVLVTAAVEGYTDAHAAAPTHRRRRRVELVRRLLRGGLRPDEVDDLAAEARALGCPLPERVAVAVSTRGVVLPPLPSEVLAVADGARHVVVLAAGGHERGDVAELAEGTVAIGPPVPWQEASHSAELAQELLQLIDAGLAPGGGIQHCEDHAAALLLASRPSLANALADRWLAPLRDLPASRREPLLETFEAWLQSPGQYTTLAEQLHVHVRTVRYRVDRLRALLGDVVDDPRRRLELTLALRAVED